ncbi:MAG: SocA family protein [Spirochaetales bacterium]|jgi:uncharacterized phage-associated protein|nr:SocA family protein [Spirochaetales bacterium]
MIDSVEFARFILARVRFINKDRENPVKMGETKLQKLLYICDGFILAAGINFIKEQARAWNYGPVYPRVHKWLEKHGNSSLPEEDCSAEALQEIQKINAEPLVDKIINVYGDKTATELSAWTHRPGSPWEVALERGGGIMNSIIKKDVMETYFKGLLIADT